MAGAEPLARALSQAGEDIPAGFLEDLLRGGLLKGPGGCELVILVRTVVAELEQNRGDVFHRDAAAVRVGERGSVPVRFAAGGEPQRDRAGRELFHRIRVPVVAEREDIVSAAVHAVVSDAVRDDIIAGRADDAIVSGIAEQ